MVSFFKDFIYLFVESGERRENERERNINVWLHIAHPPRGDLTHNPGMGPDQESNRQATFGSQAVTQSNDPHQPGQLFHFLHVCV